MIVVFRRPENGVVQVVIQTNEAWAAALHLRARAEGTTAAKLVGVAVARLVPRAWKQDRVKNW